MPGAELASVMFCSAVGGPLNLLEKLRLSRDVTSVGAEARTERRRLFPASEISRSPASNATEVGKESCASVAGPPSPLYPAALRPAAVEMTPKGVITRIRLFLLSATYRLPGLSNIRPAGAHTDVEVAATPSPKKPSCPS